MSNKIMFAGDLHFGHKNIARFRNNLGTSNEEEHRELIIENWNSVVNKRDFVWLMGDICFKEKFLPDLKRLRGNKFLVLGNHDVDGKLFAPYVSKVCGVVKYKGFWLSHVPMHPAELYGKPNIHGHMHGKNLPDTKNYFNSSLENIGYKPISMDEIKERML